MIYSLLIILTASADPQDVPDESEEEDERSEREEKDSTSVAPLSEERIIPDLDNLTKDLPSINSDEEEDLDFSFLRGSVNYSFDVQYWTFNESMKYITFFTFQGDPQYIWEQDERRWSPSLGMRFRLRNTSTLSKSALDNLIGVTTGVQTKRIRFNSAASYYNHALFVQTELERNEDSREITYTYQELTESTGIFWENTLLLQSQKKDWFLEAGVSFPFQLNGARQMGEPFTDSFRISGFVGKSIWVCGYEYSQFPGHQLHLLTIGHRLTL